MLGSYGPQGDLGVWVDHKLNTGAKSVMQLHTTRVNAGLSCIDNLSWISGSYVLAKTKKPLVLLPLSWAGEATPGILHLPWLLCGRKDGDGLE